ncbi:DUF4156 domain-containing protein [Vibrio coralliilyticus]|uniref:DUF4156 domain-containing protein n=1 Tax=Vibrio coralliilyticus TaxID=190893 RepID=UPI001E601258|nr:DUF4156 domain-containing protein [Vibrio coralliilyticus]MCC2522700.1 DUF4156 domain-containing protein [Vibrio coralliilyticus]
MSLKFSQLCTVALPLALLAGCTTPISQLNKDASDVQIRMDSSFDPANCQWQGDLTGSEGHWYTYLFYPNDVMVQGAVNQIKNRASQLGANTVYMTSPQDFTTSFTILGSAYNCPIGR